MTPRLAVTLAVLTGAALGSWYLSRSSAGDDDLPRAVESEHFGYYLSAARILGTGPDGAPLYEIAAARAEQQSDQRIEFSDVRIEYAPESEVPWTIVADTASILADQQQVRLEGHVRAISSTGLDGRETEIRTAWLALDPENFVAETDARVQIRIGPRSLTGTGMYASLNENRMEIKSNVSGRFIP